MKRPVLLFSSGLDSYCIYRILTAKGEVLRPYHILTDTKYGEYERRQVEFLRDKHRIPVEISKSPLILRHVEQENSFVPLRNLLFAALPVMEGSSVVYLAALQGEETLDKSRKFFIDTSKLFSYLLSRRITVSSPTLEMTKTALVREALRVGVTAEELRDTMSCYSPEARDAGFAGCGECQACVRRFIAMSSNNIFEDYPVDPMAHLERVISGVKPGERLKKQSVSRWPALFRNNYELLKLYGEMRRNQQRHVKKLEQEQNQKEQSEKL